MDFPKKRSNFLIWSEEKNKEVTEFVNKRSVMYPSIEEQLDNLFKDMDSGIIPGKGGKFYNSIKNVKENIKKPSWYDEYINYDFSAKFFEEDVPVTTLKRDNKSIKKYIEEVEKFLSHQDETIKQYALKLSKNANDLISDKISLAEFNSIVGNLKYLMYTDVVKTLNYMKTQIEIIYNRPA